MRRSTILLMAAPVLLAAGCSGSGATTTGSATNPPASVDSVPSASPSDTATTGIGTPSSGSTSSSTPQAQSTASNRCHTGDLKLSTGEGDGAAGTQYEVLIFTNKSSDTCTLYGYPGVSFVTGDQGTQVADPFARRDTVKKTTVTLKPGTSAHATLQMAASGNYDAAKCKPVDVRGLRIYPPDETAAIFLPRPSKECSVKGVNTDYVWAISAGTKIDTQ